MTHSADRVATWVNLLADLPRPGIEAPSANKLALVADMLRLDEFPPAALCTRSLHHVAQGERFFPAYEDIRRKVWEWWRANKPAQPQLVDESLRGLSEDERLWVGYWRRRRPEKVAEERAIVASGVAVSAGQMPVAMLNSMVRNKSPGAWAVIAAAEGWVEPERGPATEGAIAAVAAKLRVAGLSVRRSAMPEVEPARPQPRHLSPEQLHAARKAQGVRVAR